MQSVSESICAQHETKSLRFPSAFANPKGFTYGWAQGFLRSAGESNLRAQGGKMKMLRTQTEVRRSDKDAHETVPCVQAAHLP